MANLVGVVGLGGRNFKGQDGLEFLITRRYSQVGSCWYYLPRRADSKEAWHLLDRRVDPSFQEGSLGNFLPFLQRTTTLLISRSHSTELAAAAQNSQSFNSRAVVEKACCRNGT